MPAEWLANPAFDPLTGPWANPQPEQAQATLFAAWMTALNERNRRGKRPKVWRGATPAVVAAPAAVTLQKPSRQWASWIERTIKED